MVTLRVCGPAQAAMGPVESWLESWMPEEHIRSDQVSSARILPMAAGSVRAVAFRVLV